MIGLDPDDGGHDDERQGRGLHETGREGVCTSHGPNVQQRRQSPHYQQRGQEDRHENYRPGATEQGVYIEACAGADEEHGDQEPKPIASSLPLSTSWEAGD